MKCVTNVSVSVELDFSRNFDFLGQIDYSYRVAMRPGFPSLRATGERPGFNLVYRAIKCPSRQGSFGSGRL